MQKKTQIIVFYSITFLKFKELSFLLVHIFVVHSFEEIKLKLCQATIPAFMFNPYSYIPSKQFAGRCLHQREQMEMIYYRVSVIDSCHNHSEWAV